MQRGLFGWVAAVFLAAGCASIVGIDDNYVVGSPGGSAGEGTAAGAGVTGGSGGAGNTGGAPTGVTGGSGGAGTTGGSGGAGNTGGGIATGGTGGTGGAGGDPTCYPAGLIDAFDGTSVNTSLWGTQGADSIISVHGGMLHFAPQAMANFGQWAGVVTHSRYDVRDCSVWIEVPSLVTGGADGGTYFQLWHHDGRVRVAVNSGMASFAVEAGGSSDEQEEAYDSVAHRWWRFREDAGTIHIETAPDGRNWTVRNSASSPAFVDDVAIGLGVTPPQMTANPGEAQFDNFDVEP
jgi:hypothetical protein